MPNICFGTLDLIGEEKEIERVFEFIHGTDENEDLIFDFDKVIPMPENIYRGNVGAREMELYGKNNWYDWSNENWGTKWNCCNCSRFENSLHFETAWTPCSKVIKALSERFPQITFDYSYEEFEIGFAGGQVYRNGILVYEMECDFMNIFYDEDEPLDDEYKQYVDKNELTVTPITVENSYELGTFFECNDDGECITVKEGKYKRKVT